MLLVAGRRVRSTTFVQRELLRMIQVLIDATKLDPLFYQTQAVEGAKSRIRSCNMADERRMNSAADSAKGAKEPSDLIPVASIFTTSVAVPLASSMSSTSTYWQPAARTARRRDA